MMLKVVEPEKCVFDLFVVLDVSGSVEDDFKKARDFTADVISSVDSSFYASGKIAVEVVQFHTSASVAIPFKNTRSKVDLVNEVKAIEHVGGGTSTLSGIQHVIGDIKKNRRADTQVDSEKHHQTELNNECHIILGFYRWIEFTKTRLASPAGAYCT